MKNGIMKRMCVLLGVSLWGILPVQAQTSSGDLFGVSVLYGFNTPDVSFRKLPGVPNCCQEFTEGTGIGYNVGIEYFHPLYSSLSVSTRLSYVDYTVNFIDDDVFPVSIDGQTYDGLFRYTLDAAIQTIAIEQLLHVTFFDLLTLSGGVNVSIVTTATYEQKEQILQPEIGSFDSTGTKIRNQLSGDIPDTRALLLSGVAGVRFQFAINNERSLFICPEVSYRHALTDMVKGITWKPHAWRVGVTIMQRW